MKKVFILGNPRSGTTLLRIMLNSHPDIIAAPESGFMQWWYKKYATWSYKDALNSKKIHDFVGDVFSSKKIENWELDRDEIIQLIHNVKPDNYGDLCELFYISRAKIFKKTPKVIIDKNNYYIHHLETINKIWPNAYYLHLIRDGRDVACSYMAIKSLKTSSIYKPQLFDHIEDIAKEWKENNLKIEKYLNKNVKDKYLTIKYEDLVLDTEKQLIQITDLLEVNYRKVMLEYYKYNDEPKSTLDWKKNTLKKPDKNNIGKYKYTLSRKEIEKFDYIAKTLLSKYNYV
ncbi:MAG: sulfotransferase [Candidatus Marinimicrobia bacterium]|nr:sulfotransferase [Candidatus Neomarinimicrobiota bacterium]